MYAYLQMIIVVKTEQTWYNYQVLIIGIALVIFMSIILNSKERVIQLYKIWGLLVLSTIITAWWEIITNKHLISSSAYY